MRIPENLCMLQPKALKMRAIKHTMALITDSSGRTKCASDQAWPMIQSIVSHLCVCLLLISLKPDQINANSYISSVTPGSEVEKGPKQLANVVKRHCGQGSLTFGAVGLHACWQDTAGGVRETLLVDPGKGRLSDLIYGLWQPAAA